MSPRPNRRCFTRVSVRLEAMVRRADESRMPATVKDISRRGMFLACAGLVVGERCHVRVLADDVSFTVTVRVVRTVPSGAGVELERADSRSLKELAQLVEKLLGDPDLMTREALASLKRVALGIRADMQPRS